MESQVAQDDYNLLHQRNVAARAMTGLKTAMNYPVADTLVLSWEEPIMGDTLGERQWITDKPAVAKAKVEAEKARLQWKIERAALWPKLTLGAAVATNYYKEGRPTGSSYSSFI